MESEEERKQLSGTAGQTGGEKTHLHTHTHASDVSTGVSVDQSGEDSLLSESTQVKTPIHASAYYRNYGKLSD